MNAIAEVHGVDHTYHLEWLSEDLAVLVNTETGDRMEFASTHSGGFIDGTDVIEQARDIVARWDEEWMEGDL